MAEQYPSRDELSQGLHENAYMLPPVPSQGEVTVDIGVGRKSYFDGRGVLAPLEISPLGPKDVYIGVELGEQGANYFNLEYSAEQKQLDQELRLSWGERIDRHEDERSNGDNGRLYFLQADGKRLPIGQEKVDTALMLNTRFGMSEDDWLGTILEANRVLKSEGRLVIHDSVSPGRMNYDAAVRQLLTMAGLNTEGAEIIGTTAGNNAELYQKIADRYRLQPISSDPVSAMYSGDMTAWVIPKLPVLSSIKDGGDANTSFEGPRLQNDSFFKRWIRPLFRFEGE